MEVFPTSSASIAQPAALLHYRVVHRLHNCTPAKALSLNALQQFFKGFRSLALQDHSTRASTTKLIVCI